MYHLKPTSGTAKVEGYDNKKLLLNSITFIFSNESFIKQIICLNMMIKKIPVNELNYRMEKFKFEMDNSNPEWKIAVIFGKINHLLFYRHYAGWDTYHTKG